MTDVDVPALLESLYPNVDERLRIAIALGKGPSDTLQNTLKLLTRDRWGDAIERMVAERAAGVPMPLSPASALAAAMHVQGLPRYTDRLHQNCQVVHVLLGAHCQ
jgi:hypothetical protein